MNAKKLKEKAIKASKAFLTRRDLEVIESDWTGEAGGHIDIVARDNDEDAIVFVDVAVRAGTDKGFIECGERERGRLESAAAQWLAEHTEDEYVNVRIRFDSISMMVIGEDKAFLRHHINCMGQSDEAFSE